MYLQRRRDSRSVRRPISDGSLPDKVSLAVQNQTRKMPAYGVRYGYSAGKSSMKTSILETYTYLMRSGLSSSLQQLELYPQGNWCLFGWVAESHVE